MKPFISLLLAAVLFFLPVRAGAEEYELQGTGGEAQAEVLGTVKGEIISVALPCDISFVVDSDAEFNLDTGKTQVISASEARVINDSVIPVTLEISRVEEAPPENGRVELVRSLSQVNAPGRMILVMRPAGETFRSAAEFEQYAMVPAEHCSIPVARISALSQVDLQLYGKADADRFGFSFSVLPTLKISASYTSGDR